MAGRRSRKRQIPRWLLAAALAAAGLLTGFLLGLWHARGPVERAPRITGHVPPPAPAPRRPVTPPPPAARPPRLPAPAVPPTLPRPAPLARARVAIIFDDAGYSLRAAEEVMSLGRPVTISVLPDLPYSTPVAEEAARRGVEVILHLPMEPENGALPLGPGGVRVAMSDAAIERTVTSDLATVPTAVGVNNHMGSRGTADPRVMRAVLTPIRERRLFFVDSLTSPHSVGARIARAMGIRTAVRTVFLDNDNDERYVRSQLLTLLRIAQTRGEAIAIGHVGKVTASVLRSMLPLFDEAGVQLVPVSELVH
jgi:polysaccharide deacetylase 2 family uncharacterized protein YibQ